MTQTQPLNVESLPEAGVGFRPQWLLPLTPFSTRLMWAPWHRKSAWIKPSGRSATTEIPQVEEGGWMFVLFF